LNWNLDAGVRDSVKPLRFGLCADPHKDVIHDADARLRTFIDAMKKERPDFILQLGDFCRPYAKNLDFLKIWEEFDGPRYHMLGNHDTDGGFTHQKVMDFWKMPKPYYSFDQAGWHFVMLNGNEKKPVKPAPGYARFIGEAQRDWLIADLKNTTGPTLVFCHQSLEDPDGLENRDEMRAVLEKANAEAGWQKVGACFSGHHHIDYQREINDIPYIQINSMSYSWLGEKYAHIRFGPEIDKANPSEKMTAPYKDALYATVTLDPFSGITLKGVQSEFVSPDPWELGLPEKKGTSRDKERCIARISDRKIPIKLPDH
jgi:3',5'-cyclic AMP phosphodiesterase CpdA